MGELLLRPLTVDDEAAARAAHEELAADDFAFLLAQRREEGAPPETWAEYVARLEEQRHGRRLDPGFVPASFLVAEVDGEIVGRASVRHELNEFLATWGGHIGYGVRPAYRRRGHHRALRGRARPRASRRRGDRGGLGQAPLLGPHHLTPSRRIDTPVRCRSSRRINTPVRPLRGSPEGTAQRRIRPAIRSPTSTTETRSSPAISERWNQAASSVLPSSSWVSSPPTTWAR